MLGVIGRVLLVGLAVVLGIIAAIAAFFGTASVTDQPALFTAAGLASLVLVTSGGVALATRGLAAGRRRTVRILVTGVTIVAVVLSSALTIFQPLDDPNHLPTPVIYLHGGPGVSEMPEAVRFFSQLARDGFDVYVYDQIGVERSARLGDPTRYTVERNVADLEAVREQIGAERVILIGHSWGAQLAAAYLAGHQEHIAKVVFHTRSSVSLI
jgi:proline iminopeptidase